MLVGVCVLIFCYIVGNGQRNPACHFQLMWWLGTDIKHPRQHFVHLRDHFIHKDASQTGQDPES